MPLTNPIRPLFALIALAFLAACASGANLGAQRSELGDFRLSHNIAIAGAAQVGPFSRTVEAEEWEEAIRTEVSRRFSRYEGERLYHLAVHVDGYVLAMPGIPVVAAPRSVLIVGVHVWDDELGRPLNAERKQITAFEDLSGGTIIGSGLTRSAEQQMESLVRNAVYLIEEWMAENPEWFSTGAPATTEDDAAEDTEEDTAEEAEGEAPATRAESRFIALSSL